MHGRRYEASHVRDVVLLGASGVGKTALLEALVAAIAPATEGALADEEAARRRTTTGVTVASVEHGGSLLNLLDAPGDPSFGFATRLAMHAASIGVVVASAQTGVDTALEQVLAACDEVDLPRLVFVGRADAPRADPERVLDALSRLSDRAVPIALPYVEGGRLVGVIDLLGRRLVRDAVAGGTVMEEPIPAPMADRARRARELLVEAVAASDEGLLARYEEALSLDDGELTLGLARAVAARRLVPISCGTVGGPGVLLLADLLAAHAPSVADQAPYLGKDGKHHTLLRGASRDASCAAFVVRTALLDGAPYAILRMVSGSLTPDLTLVDTSRPAGEGRPGRLFRLLGTTRHPLAEAGPGDVVAIPLPDGVRAGDTLCDLRADFTVSLPQPPDPVVSLSLRIGPRAEVERVLAAARQLCALDPSLRLEKDAAGGPLLAGSGPLHLEVTVDRLRRMGHDVELVPPRVPYRETVRDRVSGEGTCQVGAALARVVVEVGPLPRGEGVRVAEPVRGATGSLEAAIRRRLERGSRGGFAVTDIEVTVRELGDQGGADAASIERAAGRAVGLAVRRSRPVLLEPVAKVEITCPEEAMGAVMRDLALRRGRVQGADARGQQQVVQALVPVAETLRYAADLRALTAGRGAFSSELSHYEELPQTLAERLWASAQVSAEEDD